MLARRSLFLAALTNWLPFVATLLVAFFIAPYLIRMLGDAQYGVWVFIESILAYFTLFDLGIAACVVRFVAKFRATGEQKELNRLVSASLLIFLIVGGIVFLLGMVCTPLFLNSLSEGSEVNPREMWAFTLLMFGNLAFTLPLSLFPAILDGLERFAAKSVIRIFFLIVRTGGTIWLMEVQPSLLALGILFTITNLLEHLCIVLACFRSLPGLRFSFRGIDRETLRLVRGYSLNAFLAMVAGRICIQSASILIGLFLTAPHITWYAIASRLVEFSKSLLRSALLTLTPAFSSLEAKQDHAGMRLLFLQATRWGLYLILPVQIGLVLFGKSFLTIWLHSEEYVRWCYPSLVILSSTLALVIAQSTAARICYGTGNLRGFARLSLLEAGVNLLLSLILIGPFGIEGVAIGSAVANLFFCLLVIISVCRTLQINVNEYLLRCWFKPLLISSGLITLWLVLDYPVRNWVEFLQILSFGLLPYGLAVWGWERPGKIQQASVSEL